MPRRRWIWIRITLVPISNVRARRKLFATFANHHDTRARFVESEKFTRKREKIESYSINLDVFFSRLEPNVLHSMNRTHLFPRNRARLFVGVAFECGTCHSTTSTKNHHWRLRFDFRHREDRYSLLTAGLIVQRRRIPVELYIYTSVLDGHAKATTIQ